MRTSALVRVSTVLGAAALGLAALVPTGAAVADGTTPLPVVVPDVVSLYPGQVTQVDVLANDSSPTGDTLALCRFPETDFESEDLPDIVAMAVPGGLGGKPGDVMVGVLRGSTHVVDYFVCDHTHLVPAQLTIKRLPVSPVTVRKVAGKPGRLSVHNTNDVAVTFVVGHPRAERHDARVRVPAGATRTVTVRRHTVAWNAEIGTSTGEFANPGSADHGRLSGIRLAGKPLPAPKRPAF